MKKVLSVLLSICMLLGTMTISFSALAANGEKSVEFSVYDGGVFTMMPTEIKVSADLSDKYDTGYNDTLDVPTILDATIAAHIAMFGDDFMDYAPLKVAQSGWITAAFGEGGNISYRQSGAMVSGLNIAVNDGDYLEYMFYQDTSSYMDKYVEFNTRAVNNVVPNQKFTLSAAKSGFDSVTYENVTLPANNLSIMCGDDVVGTTDKDGKVTLSFDKVGTYELTAETNNEGEYIFSPYCKVTVSENPLVTTVKSKLNGGAEFLLKDIKELTVDSAVDYLTYLNSGYDMSKYEKTYLASVDRALADNGRLTADAKSADALAVYGAVISTLRTMGLNPENYNGYNLVEQFESLDVNNISNPYYYRVAIEAASESFGKKLCDAFIKGYYVKGKGMNFWGFAADNTAVFLTAIAKYKDDYKDIVSDAVSVLEKHTNDDGYYYSTEYNTTSADSTAVALMAYSALGDLDRASVAYNNLYSGFESKNGIITYLGEDNAYATKEAVLACEYFVKAIDKEGYTHVLKFTKSTVKPCTGGKRMYTCADGDKGVVLSFVATSDHSYKSTVTPATTKADGKIVKKCTVCSKVASTTNISKIKSVTLDYTKSVYSGKAYKPAVEVKDAKGKTVSSKYYAVKYSANKNVGTATATVTFSGHYKGTVKKTFVINPKMSRITSVSAKKKAFKVAWTKQSKQATGYQVQYSTSKKFTSKTTKTATVKSAKTSSKTVSGLKKSKKYYVRVRTYKTVDGKKYYSGWSTVRTVKTK